MDIALCSPGFSSSGICRSGRQSEIGNGASIPSASLMEALIRPESGRVLLMGIVNITPDSFSDGGQYDTPDAALRRARQLRAEGADILDLGAESTRPGFTPVTQEEEWQRLQPVLALLTKEDGLLSVDTTKAVIAEKSLSVGAHIINDIWGLQGDAAMASVVAEYGAMIVVMHNRHEIDPALDLWDDLCRFFDRSLTIADKAGIGRRQIILDPGIGFGKTQAQNLLALTLLGRLKTEYRQPVLLGASRKSFLGHVLGRDISARLPATLAVHLYGANQGADIMRVHDVQAHADAFRITEFLEAQE